MSFHKSSVGSGDHRTFAADTSPPTTTHPPETSVVLEQLARAQFQLDRLQKLSAALADALTPTDVAHVALTQLAASLGASSGLFVLVHPERNQLAICAAFGYPPDLIDQWQTTSLSAPTPAADSARTQQPILIGSLDEAIARYPHLHTARDAMSDVAWATIPLVRHEQTLGVLSLSFMEPQEFPPDIRSLLLSLSQQCAQALERALLYETEHQARTDAEQAIRIRDHVIALLSHDLKNPLTTVLGRTALIQRQVDTGHPIDPSRINRNISAIAQAATQMLHQIEELLDNTRLQAGKDMALKPAPTDIAAMLRQLVALSVQSDRHHLLLTGAESPCIYLCDKIRMERVLLNLLNNAVKYSPAGGTITISLQEHSDQYKRWLQVSITDQGIGIPLEEQHAIFQPFYRASNGTAHAGGSGLGLASAYHVVQQHGGSLMVHSEINKGSTFIIRLPL